MKGKTVTRNLTDEQVRLCSECIQNLRNPESVIEKMKQLTVRHIEGLK